VRDSWKIAEHLEERYRDAGLFGGDIGYGVSQAFNAWVDRAVVPAMLSVIAADIHERVDPADEGHFRQSSNSTQDHLEENRRSATTRSGGSAARSSRCRRRSSASRTSAAVPRRTPTTSCFSVFQWRE